MQMAENAGGDPKLLQQFRHGGVLAQMVGRRVVEHRDSPAVAVSQRLQAELEPVHFLCKDGPVVTGGIVCGSLFRHRFSGFGHKAFERQIRINPTSRSAYLDTIDPEAVVLDGIYTFANRLPDLPDS